jgi:hypothetical protein
MPERNLFRDAVEARDLDRLLSAFAETATPVFRRATHAVELSSLGLPPGLS